MMLHSQFPWGRILGVEIDGGCEIHIDAWNAGLGGGGGGGGGATSSTSEWDSGVSVTDSGIDIVIFWAALRCALPMKM